MEEELLELESLFSEHFGRTPLSTPQLSQVSQSESEDDDDEDTPVVVDLDERARRFMDPVGMDAMDPPDYGASDDEAAGPSIVLPDGDPDVVKIHQLKLNGCGCRSNCQSLFEEKELFKHVLDVKEMEKSDKEMYIMATLIDNSYSSKETKRGKKRQRMRSEFKLLGNKVCKKVFMLAFDLGKYSLKNIVDHVNEHGAVPRVHANTGRKPIKSLQFDDVKNVVQFITNYADEFGMPQPAAPRGRDNTPPIYLTSQTTKKDIFEKYLTSCGEPDMDHRSVKSSTFNNIWRQCLPHIKIATPRDDVCARCEKIRKEIMDAVSEEEKMAATQTMQDHIVCAQKERDTYNHCIKQAKETHNSDKTYIHYTFDFSQNVSIPHHSRQMGPVYFMSLRKIQLFGFRIDGIPTQLNFLIDENETIGPDGTVTHGPNAVISMVDWAMDAYGSGEDVCSIHADNCTGQNKNQFVLGYFMWRVMTGKHKQIEYLMQVPGHARCLVDGGFASIKKLYRRSDCDSIGQLHDVVNKSSTTNVAVRYPSWQWRDWKSFLTPVFRALPGISSQKTVWNISTKLHPNKNDNSTTEEYSCRSVSAASAQKLYGARAASVQRLRGDGAVTPRAEMITCSLLFCLNCNRRKYQYFRVSATAPGVVTLKISSDAEETTVNILKLRNYRFEGDARPCVIQPGGSTTGRQQYLHRVVRPFVRPGHQDTTCPAPVALI